MGDGEAPYVGGNKLGRTPVQGGPVGRPPLAPPAAVARPAVADAGAAGNLHRPQLGGGTGADYGGEKLRRTPAQQQQQRRPASAGDHGLGTRTQREQQGGGGDKLRRTGAAQQPPRENQPPPAQGRGGPAGPSAAAPAPGGAGPQRPSGAPPGGDLVSPNWQFRRVITPRKIPRPFTAVRTLPASPGVRPSAFSDTVASDRRFLDLACADLQHRHHAHLPVFRPSLHVYGTMCLSSPRSRCYSPLSR